MTINDRLSSMTNEMSILADLEANERPHQDENGTFISKYTNPNEGVSSFISASVQALQRSRSGQSTRVALKHIEKIADEILRYAVTRPTPFEYYMTYSNRIEKFSQLLCHITEVLDSGLPNFLETSTTCSSSLYSQSKSEIEERKALFETTTKKVRVVANKLKEKVQEYNELNACASEQGLPPVKEHLYTIIEMILNPDPKLNISTLNINGYQNFCADIAKELLIQSFGSEHVGEVFRFYGLEHAIRLTYPDLQAVIIGIVANLAYRDIETILKKPNGIAYNILVEKLPKGIPSELDEHSTLFILDILRTIDVGGAYCPIDRCYGEQLYGDLLFLESCKKFVYYNWKKSAFPDSPIHQLRKFGPVEQVAREYVFGLFRTDKHNFRQGILFPSIDHNGMPFCFEGHLVYRKDGINVLAAIPQPNISTCHDLINISFRGTYQDEDIPVCQSTSQAKSGWSLWGKTDDIAFEEINRSIVTHFISIANRVSNPNEMKIEICGQGIGGCAAQRFAEVLSNHFTVRKEDYQNINLSEVNLYCFDSPTIEEPIVGRFIKNCMTIPEIKFTLRYFSSHIRKLTWYGGTHFLGFLENESVHSPKNLEVTWINFSFLNSKNETVEQLADAYPSTPSAIERFYEPQKTWGNNDPFFMERNKYDIKKGNPVLLNYYCTTNNDIKIIRKGRKVDVTKLPEILTAGFTLET